MSKRAGGGLLVVTLALTLAVAGVGPLMAAEPTHVRTVPIKMNAGESYVISDLDPNQTPSIRVVSNSNALIVHGDKPGELVLLGAARGEWIIKATSASGELVKYDISVQAIASPFTHPLSPGTAPPPLELAGSGGASAASSAAAPLDPGSGPIASAGATASPIARVTEPSADGSTGTPQPKGAGTAESGPDSRSSTNSIGHAGPAASDPAQIAASSAPMMPSQAASGAAQLPPRKFRVNPAAVPPMPGESNAHGGNPLPNEAVVLTVGSSRIFDFGRRIRRISIADTDVADLQVINPYQINLVGHKPGFTTLAVWDAFGQYEERQIRVDEFGRAQVMLNVLVAELDRNRIEQQGVNWSAALPKYNVSLVGLGPGGVATQYTSTSNITSSVLLGAGTPTQTLLSTTATGTLPPPGQIIPLLLSPTLNYGLTGSNSNVSTQTFFSFLETHNLGKILAEPHLLANSGEKAEFLSGGEIPIVVAQALNTSIVFKQFGTSIIFVPTVIGSDDIELEVKPEVSQPDYAHAVNLFGFSVPAFVTRRAQTFVRLKNNQTFIIAGLILHTPVSEVDKTPYLGDVPFVGGLFRHTQYTDQSSDLVMTVTPQIVQPLPSNGTPFLPPERGPLTSDEIRTQRLAVPDASRPRF